MGKLKILHAIYCLGRGGAEKLSIEIVRELNKRNDTEALLVSFDKTVSYEYDTKDLNYLYCPSKVDLSVFGKEKFFTEDYKNVLMRFKPDIIHSHRFLSEIITRFEILENVKYITHCHDNIKQFSKISADTFFSKRKITNFYERAWLLRKYRECNNHFIAVSTNTLSFLENNLPKDLHHFSLLPNAIDFNKFKKPQFKSKKVFTDQVKLISIGNFTSNKNQKFLIEVLSILRKQGLNATLELLGDGKEKGNIIKHTHSLGLSDHVFFRGNVDNVENYLHNADIYVHSSFSESFGLALIEAMAAGLPIVCLDAKGNRDIMRDGHNGFMLNDFMPELFAKKIIQLISDPDLYDTISGNAVKFAMNYDIKKYVDDLVQLYKSLLKV